MYEIDNPDAHCESKVVVHMIILRASYTFPSIHIHIHIMLCTSHKVISHVVWLDMTLTLPSSFHYLEQATHFYSSA